MTYWIEILPETHWRVDESLGLKLGSRSTLGPGPHPALGPNFVQIQKIIFQNFNFLPKCPTVQYKIVKVALNGFVHKTRNAWGGRGFEDHVSSIWRWTEITSAPKDFLNIRKTERGLRTWLKSFRNTFAVCIDSLDKPSGMTEIQKSLADVGKSHQKRKLTKRAYVVSKNHKSNEERFLQILIFFRNSESFYLKFWGKFAI